MSNNTIDRRPTIDKRPPIACPVCGKELAFIEYGSKPGKDGRIAKWPIYEKCDKSEHKTKKAEYERMAREDLSVTGSVFGNAPVRIVEGRSGPKGILYALAGFDQRSVDKVVDLYLDRFKVVPKVALANDDVISAFAGVSVPFEFAHTDHLRLTPGFRYLFLLVPEE